MLRLALLCLIALTPYLAAAQDPAFTLGEGDLARSVSRGWLLKTFPSQAITVRHPLHEGEITYKAIPLAPVIESLGWISPQLRFRCSDGYRPVVSRADVAPLGLALAVGEIPPAKGADFTPLSTERGPLDPAPFLVIAASPQPADALPGHTKFSWPYQVVGVAPFDAEAQYAAMVPTGAAEGSDAAEGYALFRAHCISCHSVNQQGGVVGPELNVPKNITEYRDPEWLAQFIANPSAWRARDKMPAFEHLGAARIKQLIAYLSHMKDHKR